MKFGYTIIYVPDVPKAIVFYENAFGLKCRFLHESNAYAEMETGATALAFVLADYVKDNGISFEPLHPGSKPPAIEIAFVSDDVEHSYQQAIAQGASPLQKPHMKPWGQTVSYLRDLNGLLVEICSPIQA